MSYDDFELSRFGGQPVECYLFETSAAQYRFTTADEPITLDDGTYEPDVARRESIDYSQERDGGNLRIGQMHPSHPIVAMWVGHPPSTPIQVHLFRKHRGDAEFIRAFRGEVIGCEFEEGNVATLICAPGTTSFDRELPVLTYAPKCVRDHFGPGCGKDFVADGIDIADFTHTATVTAIAGAEITADEFGAHPDGYFTRGLAQMASGEKRDIIAHVGDTITLLVPFGGLEVDDEIEATAGCDRTRPTCSGTFNNLHNNLSCPDIPTRNPYRSSVV